MKILYITTIGETMNFFKELISELMEDGNTVDIACNGNVSPVPEYYKELNCSIYQISCSRSPLKKENLDAVRQIRSLVAENHYDIVHCHTPVASVCARLACRKFRKSGLKVIYTAHGFHFYKGAPLKNWLVYYPVEKLCAHFTDVLITINKEDFERAKKKFRAKKVEYVPGVGVDLERFNKVSVDKAIKREELGITQDATLLISVGELNKNKNHEVVIRAVEKLNEPNIYYVIAGKGELKGYLQNLIDELGMNEKVKLLGFRSDVAELLQVADVYILPSIREGLNVSLMEAMASGLPCVVSDIRGNRDLVEDGIEGLLIEDDEISVVETIRRMISSEELRNNFGIKARKKVEKFDLWNVQVDMMELYRKIFA